MADKPILFSGPMVRALLDGRKTQTRRVFKGAVDGFESCKWSGDGWDVIGNIAQNNVRALVPPIKPGDRLWVRENVRCGAFTNGKPSEWSPSFYRREQGDTQNPAGLWYDADGLRPTNPIGPPSEKSTPSIFMPRWASRVTLIVTDVRVQRLQNISDPDAIAEGIESTASHFCRGQAYRNYLAAPNKSNDITWFCPPKASFRSLWDSLNADRGFGWDTNPWVVAYTFETIKQNIDQISLCNAGGV